jgi:quercetin dioxygenase-like cupin family protein
MLGLLKLKNNSPRKSLGNRRITLNARNSEPLQLRSRGNAMEDFLDRRTMLGSLAACIVASPLLQALDAHSVVMDAKDAREDPRPFGTVRRYIDGPAGGLKHLLVSQTTLQAGQEPHPPHSHPEAEILIVTEGSGEVSLRGKAAPIGPGGLLYAAPNDLHGIRNSGSVPLKYCVFRWLLN